jgi:integrase
LNRVDEQRAPRTNATIAELLDAYFEVVDIDRATMRGWRGKVRNHIGSLLGATPVKKAQARVFERFYAELRRCRTHCDKRPAIDHRTRGTHGCDRRCRPHQCQGLAASTIREIHTILNGAFGRAVAWDWLGTNPLDHVKPPEAAKPNPQPPTADDAARLVNQAWRNDLDWGTYIWLAMTTGKRRGELCGLRLADVDLDTATAQFWLAIKQAGTELYTGEPKGGRLTRVALDPESVEVLREHLDRCAAWAAEADIELDPEGFVFSDAPDHSTPWRPDSVTQRFGRLRDQLGIKTTLHKLRHYSATELIIAGVDVATVAGRLGHASASTTLNFYTAWVSEADQRAAKALSPRLPQRPQASNRSEWAKVSPVSPYEVIAAGLREAIAAGELGAGMPIPSEKQLATEHGVSAGTAHRAVELLKSWGLVDASRGKRATVRPRDDLAQAFAADSHLEVTHELQQPVQRSVQVPIPRPVQGAVHSPVRETVDQPEHGAQSGPDRHSPTTGLEELDLELTHLGRSVRTYRTCADPTNSETLLQLLRDAIRRTGGQDSDAGDYELVVRYAGERGVVTTVVAPPQSTGGLVGVA